MVSVLFLGVIGIDFVAGPNLGSGVSFSGELVLWLFMRCGVVRLHSWSDPCLHSHRIVYVRVYILILFGCGFTLFDFPDTI